MSSNEDTTFLFATPNFWQGMASALDMGGTLVVYNNSRTVNEADRRAIASDWAVTGKDIRRALESFGEK